MSIEIKNISKKIAGKQIVDDVSFSVSDNQITAFLGENGAGKSTTLKMISSFLLPDSGQILINGLDLSVNRNDILRQIGYLPENNPIYGELYVKEYLEFVAKIFGLKKKQAVNDVIEKVGLNKECHKKIKQLSKGYKQRVGLAQTIIHKPSVLLLDEPTTGLDPNQLFEIRQILLELAETCSILYSTHNLHEVCQLGKNIVFIHEGRIQSGNSSLDSANITDEESLYRCYFRTKQPLQ